MNASSLFVYPELHDCRILVEEESKEPFLGLDEFALVKVLLVRLELDDALVTVVVGHERIRIS